MKNNRAYSLIAIGRFVEGFHLITSYLGNSDGDARAIATATLGFFHMRTGDYTEGTKLYRDAIASFRRSNNSTSECLAWAYFAFEAARADLPDAAQIFSDATDACKKGHHLPEARIVLERAENWSRAVAHRKNQPSSS